MNYTSQNESFALQKVIESSLNAIKKSINQGSLTSEGDGGSDRIVKMEVGVEIFCRWGSREEVGGVEILFRHGVEKEVGVEFFHKL